MSEINRIALFGKLNSRAFQSIESATVFCKMRGNPYVELAHYLHQILKDQDSDLHRIIRFFDLDAGRIATQLQRALDALPRGATAISDLSPHLEECVERAWIHATLGFGVSQVRTGHLLLGMLTSAGLSRVLQGISPELAGIDSRALTRNFDDAVAGSPETGLTAQDGSHLGDPGTSAAAMAPQAESGEALATFCKEADAQAIVRAHEALLLAA